MGAVARRYSRYRSLFFRSVISGRIKLSQHEILQIEVCELPKNGLSCIPLVLWRFSIQHNHDVQLFTVTPVDVSCDD